MRANRARWTWLPLALLTAASPVLAQEAPEQLEQIEPAAGERQAEYYGAFGGHGEQSVELLAGVSDQLVLGAEIEFHGPRDGLRLDSVVMTDNLATVFHAEIDCVIGHVPDGQPYETALRHTFGL